MSTPCALCGDVASGKLAACQQLIDSPLSAYTTPGKDVLRCAQCADEPKKHATQRLCKSCRTELLSKHEVITDEAKKRGWMLITRARRLAAGFEDPTPIPMIQEGDLAKIAVFALPSQQRIEQETIWVNEIRAEGKDWFSGAINNDVVLCDPKSLKLGDRVRFKHDHIVRTMLSNTLPARTDGHACKLCDPTVGPPRIPDELSVQAIETVRKTGWYLLGVASDEEHISFTYSLGLHHTFGLHDLFVSGLDVKQATAVLNRLVLNRPASGGWPLKTPLDDIFVDARAAIIELADSHELRRAMTWTRWFEDGPSPCAQLVWSDRNGSFPWDDDVDDALLDSQILLPPRGSEEE